MTKEEIRRQVLRRRLALDERDVQAKSAAICARLISDDVFVAARVIGLYWPFRNEVLTQSIFSEAASRGKRVTFPVVRARERMISYVEVGHPSELAEGAHGIMEPPLTAERVVRPEDLDLIVIPGVVFDARGYRIGYGGGYFDRLLSVPDVRAVRAATAFDIQVVAAVPHEDHDQRVDVIFTETRTIECR